MKIDISTIPTTWQGTEWIPADCESMGLPSEPRLSDYLLFALHQARLGPQTSSGQMPEGPESLLKRAELVGRVADADGPIELSTDDLKLLEACISASMAPAGCITVLNALHASRRLDG